MPEETTVRERLGIPSRAEEVLVIAESTHWDPDWLLTSREYLRLMVAPTLDRALDALQDEPRRVYSVECAFFPEAYLRLRPERRGSFVQLANEGRLRFTGSGVTTPDTLLPEDELVLRDLLEGSEWLRRQEITAEPRTLYLPDSFGHSPGLPALLAAAGVPYAAICRIDGMRFPGAELQSADHFPWPGTSAARLVEEGSADFIWRSPDGSEVLTHWHAFGYGHGDLIGHGGFTRAMGLPLAWPSRDPAKVAERVETYLDQLRPLARTPYRLLSIGFDFSRPVPRLTELIDTWNAAGYERTGVWLLNAALEDYLDLVSTRSAELPTLELDPNPYWSGFYATRPALKRACRDLGRDLVALDNSRARHRFAPEGHDDPSAEPDRCARARWIAATANHHDLITGTSPDRTARREQWPWLDRAHREVCAALGRPAPPAPSGASAGSAIGVGAGGHVGVRAGDRITVASTHFTATFDESRGGTLTSLVDAEGNELAGFRTLSCVAVAESGGLWRMGHEFPGGKWRRVDETADHPATVTTERTAAGLHVIIDASLEGRPVRLEVDFPDDAPAIVVTTSVAPRLRRTVTLVWQSTTSIGSLVMHQPGGVVSRPLRKRYDPTFWPLHSWAVAAPPSSLAVPSGLALATAVPTAVHAGATGALQTVVARTALRELAWGVVPLLGPALGYERGVETAHLAFGRHDPAAPAHRTGRALQANADRAAGRHAPAWIVTLDDADTEVLTVKPAERGDGVIVRVRHWNTDRQGLPGQVQVRMHPDIAVPITGAWRCDSNERDIDPLEVVDGAVRVPIDSHLVSIRLLT